MKPLIILAVFVSLFVVADCVHAEDVHLFGTLVGRQEVPPITTLAKGTFNAVIGKNLTELTFDLEYSQLGANVTQAHIHFGQEGVNGGIMVFLCSNLPDRFVQPCPNSGHISGTIRASDIYPGTESQGIGSGNFFAFQRAIRQGAAYVNVHSATFPSGEIRGQIRIEQLLDNRSPQELTQGCVLANILRQVNPNFAELASRATIPPLDQCVQPPPDGGVQKVVVCTGHACTCHDIQECACMEAWCGKTTPDPEKPGNETGFCVGLGKLGMTLTCAYVVDQ